MANLNDMMVFASVVDKGSFTAAANAYELPKSNISRKVSRLEEHLGVRLLERSTRKLHLTEIGEIYYRHCVRIQEEIESARLSIDKMAASPIGQLNICASITVGQNFISRHLHGFQQKYPQVTLNLQLTNRRVDVIEEGFDLVLRVGDLKDSNLVARRLCQSELMLFASPEYLKRKPKLTNPDALSHHQCLHASTVSQKPQWRLLKNQAENNKKESIVDFKPAFICDDFTVLRKMAINGAGIARLPSYICRQAINERKLVRVLPDWAFKTVDIYALFPSHKGATPKVRVFIDYLIESLKH
ncbi:LysR family transcriptional regulator [Aliikangiella coralliicola]|uniref:LysR family transcriptional regulator n=1 Tax=Aliikangiella coralliicola TaxID=2592383 RepID=A0A545UGA6_9GAMM|nr:LysR family transcriptional regulator [Aliikangiella coralliicola]TQV88508.1 LysR family transcriptional regulator [Aliikangiella coralliicola]